ncbi:MAG: ABC transporter transmembrane domain-containing protein, partial [Alphaproteobacteria bacterium]|nr:ABC transporter transmembrane domain-containing protein [Alphaproteobacteria bacterium]
MAPLKDRPKSKTLAPLRQASVFLKPYTSIIFFAAIALLITSGSVLGLGTGLRYVIDQGISQGDGEFLDQALWGMLVIVLVFSIGTYARFYMVTWLGEKVVADIRNAVYAQVLKLSPGFFEVTKTGEILTRLTTDTTLLQTVIGSSVSLALRNILMLTGGLVMLVVTNGKLAGLVALVVPVVVVPIIVYGRKVRKLSRDSQDKVAGVGAFAEESLNGIRTVQAFGHEKQDRERFDGEVQ